MDAVLSQPDTYPPPSKSAVFSSPRWERITTAFLLILFVIVGANNIGNRAFEGQDYGFHVQSTFRLIKDPSAWFAQDITHRPLIYWIAIRGFHLTEGQAPFHFASFVFLMLNTGALWLLHDSTRRYIASPALRLAALTLIAFWPATTITTVVFAADGMAPPFFALLCWSLLRWYESTSDSRAFAFAVLGGIALSLGNFAKFTFLFLPAGILTLAFLAWRWRHANIRRVLGLALLTGLAPAAIGGWLHYECHQALAQQPERHEVDLQGTGQMTWRSLLTLKRSDARIFDAPGYWDPEIINGKTYLPLLRENDYTYGALLHLGTFTDVLDFAAGGSQRDWTPRPNPQKAFSKGSVRLGVVFSVPTLIAVVWFTSRTLRSAVIPRGAPPFALVVWLVLGLNWFVPLAVSLPFIERAYHWGYWLPRLVLPGLWSFGLCLYTWIDAGIGERHRIHVAIAAVTLLQTAIQIASVWY